MCEGNLHWKQSDNKNTFATQLQKKREKSFCFNGKQNEEFRLRNPPVSSSICMDVIKCLVRILLSVFSVELAPKHTDWSLNSSCWRPCQPAESSIAVHNSGVCAKDLRLVCFRDGPSHVDDTSSVLTCRVEPHLSLLRPSAFWNLGRWFDTLT